jgi:hypothetical protein
MLTATTVVHVARWIYIYVFNATLATNFSGNMTAFDVRHASTGGEKGLH